MSDNHNFPAIRFSGFLDEWTEIQLGDAVDRYKELIETPKDGYWRLGVRSHAKGTFLSYVAAGEQLGEKELSKVAANVLIVNIVFAWEHAVAITTKEDIKALVSHRFPQFVFHDDMVSEFFKYAILDGRFKYHLYLASPSGAGRNKTLSINDMLCYQMNIPKLMSEQEKVGAYFNTLDKKIELEKVKCQKLFSIKRFLLDKMFPEEGKNVPEIRFAEFTDAWEQRKLGGISNRVTRKNKDLESTLPLTISAQYGLVDQVTFFNKQVASKDTSGYFLLKHGEFAYNKSYSKDYPWGVVKRLNKYDMGVLSTLYIVFKPTEVDSDFLVSYYETEGWHKEVAIRAAEGARNHGLLNITATDFFDTELMIPIDNNEQVKIGQFFTVLEKTITLHQRRVEKLQNIKSACLEKMFV